MEQEYALRIESLGYKYSNSITQQAVNPLVPHGHNSPIAAAGATGKGFLVFCFGSVLVMLFVNMSFEVVYEAWCVAS